MHVAPRRLFENVIVVQYIGLVGVTLLTLFSFQAAFGNVLTRANLEVLAMNMVFEGIMALGMTFVIIMGGIDLSVASVFAFSEILVAKLMVQAGFAIVPAILVTLLAAAAIGALNGVLIVLFRVHPLIITMGTLLTLRGVNLAITDGHSVSGFSETFLFLGQGKILGDQCPDPFLRRRCARPRRPAWASEVLSPALFHRRRRTGRAFVRRQRQPGQDHHLHAFGVSRRMRRNHGCGQVRSSPLGARESRGTQSYRCGRDRRRQHQRRQRNNRRDSPRGHIFGRCPQRLRYLSGKHVLVRCRQRHDAPNCCPSEPVHFASKRPSAARIEAEQNGPTVWSQQSIGSEK